MQEPRLKLDFAKTYRVASSLLSLPGARTPSKATNMMFAGLKLFSALGTELQFRAMSPFLA